MALCTPLKSGELKGQNYLYRALTTYTPLKSGEKNSKNLALQCLSMFTALKSGAGKLKLSIKGFSNLYTI